MMRHAVPWALACALLGGWNLAAAQDACQWQDPYAAMRNPLPPLGDERIHLEAQQGEMHFDEFGRFSGSVHMLEHQGELYANSATYDPNAQTVSVQGGVLLLSELIDAQMDQAVYSLKNKTADATMARFLVKPQAASQGAASMPDAMAAHPGRGTARQAMLAPKAISRLRGIAYTTCPPGNEDWEIRARTLKLDHQKQVGVARDATLRVRGVPVMYTPYIDFSLNNARKSGFLAPQIGNSGDRGFELATPYYWNIAPNLDMTLVPHHMSRRGEQGSGQLRYLTSTGSGELVGEYLPGDDLANQGHRNDLSDDLVGKDRSMVSIRAQQRLGSQWWADTDFTDVSDPEYFDDFNSTFVHSNDFYMPRRAGLHFDSTNWMGQLRLQDWEVVDPLLAQITRPYQVMPQLDIGSRHPIAIQDTPLVWDWHVQGTRFSRNSDAQGRRIDAEPGIGLDFHGPGYFLFPRVGYRYTGYELDHELATMQGTGNETPSRQTPIVSIDSGLIFERQLFESVRQTLEPRLFALYVPRRDQDAIPIFDTGETDFTFDRLFRTNRFNGTDRLGDARQLSASLGSRFIGDETGREWAHAQVGQMVYFGNQKVGLPNQPVQRRSYSNTLMQLDTQPLTQLGTHLFLEVDPSSGNTKQADARVSYQPYEGATLTGGYRRNEDIPQTLTPSDPLYFSPYLQGLWRPGATIEEMDVSAAIPVTHNLNLVGRWFHSLKDDTDLQVLAGAEYRSCCWAVRGVWRRYADAAGINSETSSAFYVEFELTGFTTLGDRVSDLLGRNIPGYKPL